MGKFSNLNSALSGAQNPQGLRGTTQTAITEAFTKAIYPGIPLFGTESTPDTWTLDSRNSRGEAILSVSSFNAIQFIHNDGYFNSTVPDNDTYKSMLDPTMNVLCVNTGEPYRILRVLDETHILISDPYELFGATEGCWYAKSEFQPNKKVFLHSEFSFNCFGIGAAVMAPVFNGANYILEAGDGINPIDVIGLDSATFSHVIK